MALSTPAMGRIADAILADSLRADYEAALTEEKFWECVDKVRADEMTERLVWSPEGDLSFVFEPVEK